MTGVQYTAAIASFKVFGKTPQASQYLLNAVESSSHAMIKILARKTRPAGLNNSARSMNGPEEAHDYLWLTQELWMEDDVWNWANGEQAIKKFVLKPCDSASCKKVEEAPATFQRCSNCHGVVYCGKECQKEHWPAHKAGTWPFRCSMLFTHRSQNASDTPR